MGWDAVFPPGTVDLLNTTTTPLAAGATWTGSSSAMQSSAVVFVNVHAEPSTATGTITVSFSQDGTNFDRTVSYPVLDPTTNPPIRVGSASMYYRVSYVNGSVEQTALRLYAIEKPAYTTITTTKRSTIGYTSTMQPVRVANSVDLDRARGILAPESAISKFGRNPAVGITEADIWSLGGAYTGWLTAAVAVRVKAGGNTNDTAAGTGAQSVTIVGLDQNWEDASETVATAGSSASSATTTTFIRVFRAYVQEAGTYGGSNAAAMTLETTGGAAVAHIEAGFGQTQMSMYTIPAGKTGYMGKVAGYASGLSGTKATTMKLWQRQNANDATGPTYTAKRVIGVSSDTVAGVSFDYEMIPPLPEMTDIWASAITSSGTSGVDIRYNLVLVDNGA